MRRLGVCGMAVACVLSLLGAPPPQAAARPAFKVVGYYAGWDVASPRAYSVSMIPGRLLTHVNYAFAAIKDGRCDVGDITNDPDNFAQLLLLKRRYPSLRTLISVGGASGSAGFASVAASAPARRLFARSCVAFMKANGFDGLDIDWEFPTAAQSHSFTLVLGALRAALAEQGAADGRAYLLTIAAPATADEYGHLELERLARVLDWVNIMAYDYHGSWEKSTNFLAPLRVPASDPAGVSIEATVHAYSQKMPARKIVLGLPFYGFGWSGVAPRDNGLYRPASGPAPGTGDDDPGVYDYRDLAAHYIAAPGRQTGYHRYRQGVAATPWLYSPVTRIFITYDDPQSLGAKTAYIKAQGLGGAMAWELGQDDHGALLRAVAGGLITG